MRIGSVLRSAPPRWQRLTAVKIGYETADFNEAPQMQTPDDPDKTNRSDVIRAGLQFFTRALQMASISFSPTPPDQARASIRIALVGVIKLISDLHPHEPSFSVPFNQLLYDLDDLDHGKVAPLLKPKKVRNRPRAALSEDLFRAIVAAAMTRLVNDTKMSREKAARDIARRLSKIGGKHPSGAPITPSQIGKWREKMMTERASENLAVARYERSLQLVSGMEPLEAVALMLSSLTDLSPANFPKKPPA
jgi:hypothetical protein